MVDDRYFKLTPFWGSRFNYALKHGYSEAFAEIYARQAQKW